MDKDQRLVNAPIFSHECGGMFIQFDLREDWKLFFTHTVNRGIAMFLISPSARDNLLAMSVPGEEFIGDAICHAAGTRELTEEDHAEWMRGECSKYAEVMRSMDLTGEALEGEDVMVDYLQNGSCVPSMFESAMNQKSSELLKELFD